MGRAAEAAAEGSLKARQPGPVQSVDEATFAFQTWSNFYLHPEKDPMITYPYGFVRGLSTLRLAKAQAWYFLDFQMTIRWFWRGARLQNLLIR